MTPTDRPSKRDAFLTFLQDGWVTIYVDARRAGVSVPEHLRSEPRLVLQYGLNMPVPVEDLEVTEGGIKATLSFSRQPYTTMVPWTAVYVIACTDGRGVLYQEDVPGELLEESRGSELAADESDEEPFTAELEPPARKTEGSEAADDPGDTETTKAEAAEAADAAAPAPPRRRLKSVPMPDDNVAAPVDEGDEPEPEAKPRGRPKLRLVKP
ncbi:MAG: hypothetical protein KA712_11825 [Myxococcales bacterium]|nr:hypothetical protein [Myxococcales bacterium]